MDSLTHAVAELGLWRGVKGLTPIAELDKKKVRFVCHQCFHQFLIFAERRFCEREFLRIDVLIYLRCGAMCFASGSIFGNKFLTPVGIKTLFPIFENSLCGKELVVETQTFEQRKFLPFILWPNLLNKFFSFFGKEEPVFHLVAWQHSGLRVRWVGNLLFVSS